MVFKNKVLIIGYGAVARCALPLLLKHVKVPCKNITIIDMLDKRNELRHWTKRGVTFVRDKVNPINLYKVLSQHVSMGGIIIDLAWNIDCIEILTWCHDNKVLYINTSVEEWDPFASIHRKSPFEKSLFYRQSEIRKLMGHWQRSTTAVIDHGANPGLVSHFTKRGITDIVERAIRDKTSTKKSVKAMERLVEEGRFAELAMRLGVKTIHISERDTQISRTPKKLNEFVGTWSIEALREEGMAPAEMGWGTHEKEMPLFATFPPSGPKNQIFLSQMGMNTWVRSWIPYQEIVGMAIRHAEAFSISDDLTVWDGGRVVYRPTALYAYLPCDDTGASLHELRCRNYEIQRTQRILRDDIVEGEDTLGVLIMGHRYNSWWTGSILTIEESRRLIPGQNATTMQVAVGAISAIVWMLENRSEGVMVPDALPHEEILETAMPYLGRFVSEASDWTPFKNYQIFFKENPDAYLDKKNPWNFRNFLFKD